MSVDTQQQEQLKVLLIGELCQDVYVFGEVNRISPEAPVPVLKKTDKRYKDGMSGNVYNNLASILPNASITLCQNNKTDIKKIRFIDKRSNYQIMRYDIENKLTGISLGDIPENSYDVIVISDYNKGFIDSKVIYELTSKFKKSKIFVDTKKQNLSCFQNSTIKLNEQESKKAKFVKKSSEIITTLGSIGCEYQGKIYPSKSVEVYDVCGAGDVFLAALTARWVETNNMQNAINTANRCAALSVTKLGCYTITRDEYENLCI